MKRLLLGMAMAAAGCASDTTEEVSYVTYGVVAGAGYTTFDATMQGCEDSPNGINCNNYTAKDRVYMSGGPRAGGLSDGQYYFAVLAPGSQNGGFMEGAEGNLSDTVAGGTAGDLGTGDAIENRTFTVADGELYTYVGTHPMGTSPNGRAIVGLFPFDDTPNPGGVYILALCSVGATQPSQCKYDAFRIAPGQDIAWGTVSGGKYYDSNANGTWDFGEVGIAQWPIEFVNGMSGQLWTSADGTFQVSLIEDGYHFEELVSASPWMQTGNRESQLVTTGDAVAVLNADMTYDMHVTDNSTVTGVFFGNLCVGRGGGHTLGFWSNKNGRALVGADDLAALRILPLVDAGGAAFDPGSYGDLRPWLLNATAVNMAYMLSVQLAAMQLNVLNGFVDENALVYAPGAESSNLNGFTTIYDLLGEAAVALAASPYTVSDSAARAMQESLKDALDRANNDTSFVQRTQATCPAPTFP